MPKLIMRGAYLRHAVIQDEEAGVFVRVHVTADFSKPVCETMGWAEFAANVESAKLEGELHT